MSETLFIGQAVHLQGMNIFDIGGNKQHINFGLMNAQIASLSSQIDSISKSTKQIAIPGYILSLIEENDEVLLNSLKSLVKENNINLLSVPYYNSSLSLISADELTSQLNLQEEITAKHFGKKSIGFFCSEGILPPNAESSLNGNFSRVFHPEKSKLTLKNPSYKLKQTSVSYLGEKVTSLVGVDSIMESHLMAELRNIHSPIIAFGDEDTLTSWRFMTQPSMILRANPSNFHNDAYEHYMQMMNTLNDVAHKIKTVQLAKKGLFQDKPTISDSPSSLIMN